MTTLTIICRIAHSKPITRFGKIEWTSKEEVEVIIRSDPSNEEAVRDEIKTKFNRELNTKFGIHNWKFMEFLGRKIKYY